MPKQNSLNLTLGNKNTPNGAQYPLIMWPMHLQRLTLLTSNGLGGYDAKRCPVPSTSCDMHVCNCKFEVAISTSLRDTFTRTYIIWPWHFIRGNTKHCPIPSTSCHLCISKVWCCFVQWFRRRCIYKKIHYLTFDLILGSRPNKILPSTLYIMLPMHMHSLKVLRLTV